MCDDVNRSYRTTLNMEPLTVPRLEEPSSSLIRESGGYMQGQNTSVSGH